jgi:hypothetical protein
MDLETSGTVTLFLPGGDEGEWVPIDEPGVSPGQVDCSICNLKANMLFASLWYGVNKNLDVLVRLGTADATDEVATGGLPDTIQPQYSLGGGYGFAGGLGARANLWQYGRWKIGGVGQITWFNPGTSTFSFSSEDDIDSGTIDLNLWQAQIAVGTTRDVKGVCVYGGPFMQWTGGKLNLQSVRYSEGEPLTLSACEHDINVNTTVGAFIGASGKVRGRVSWYAEGQITGDSCGLAIGLTRKSK